MNYEGGIMGQQIVAIPESACIHPCISCVPLKVLQTRLVFFLSNWYALTDYIWVSKLTQRSAILVLP